MNKSNELKDDLNFVSEVVRSSENLSGAPAIYFLWALIIPIGFSLADFYPQWVGNFWMVAGPLGGVISGFLGWRYCQRVGQIQNDEMKKNLIHWGSMMFAIFMASSLVELKMISGQGMGAVALLIVSLSYIMAGNYLDRGLFWAGVIMLAGFFPVVYSIQYTWSMVGVFVSVGLIIAAVRALRSERA